MADESLCSVQDAEALLPVGAGIRWNLRLAKVGGFTGLLELAALARTHGIPCQLGALVGETSILTAAARACLGITDFRWVESAFPRLLLRTDPVVGGALATRPVAAPLSNTTPGLGVALAERAVKRLLVARVDLA
jgi:L-alanine-DL-glutamate epimerase-like enolase superfamily enzyme